MGGSAQGGNVTPAAEFNIHVDPEAAAVVFESGAPLLMVGLDATSQALARPADVERLRALGSPQAETVAAILDGFGRYHRQRLGWEGVPIHDALAVAAVMRPELLTTRRANVVVETSGVHTLGQTVCDFRLQTGRPPNAEVAIGVDREAFLDLLVEGIACYGRGAA
jgi:pyrimidine-specific ribonucleoside hydrolase